MKMQITSAMVAKFQPEYFEKIQNILGRISHLGNFADLKEQFGNIQIPDDSHKYSDDHRVWKAGEAGYSSNLAKAKALFEASPLFGCVSLGEWTDLCRKSLSIAITDGSVEVYSYADYKSPRIKKEIANDYQMQQTLDLRMSGNSVGKVLVEMEEFVIKERVLVPDQLYKIGSKKGEPRTFKSIIADVTYLRCGNILSVEWTDEAIKNQINNLR
jgi:hypothetical protein